jgi:hypothetical protein
MKKIEENMIEGKIVKSESGYDERGNYVIKETMITIAHSQNDEGRNR